MIKIGTQLCGFTHSTSTTLYKIPKHITWVHNQILPITVWFDNGIRNGIHQNCETKIAWLLESNCIIPDAVDFVKNNVELVSKSYKFLLTHNKDIANLAPNFHHIFPHGFWIQEPKMYPKSKLVSIISSNKNFTSGHQKRLEFVNKFRDRADLYGRGFNDFEKHEDALCDYFFNICVENERISGYSSEKLFSCFASGTIPVLYGDYSIGEHFNKDGIIELTEDFDIDSLTPKLYSSKIDAVKDNLERVKRYDNIEDDLWENYISFYYNN